MEIKKICYAAAVASIFAGCKPTQANYRAAYESAIQTKEDKENIQPVKKPDDPQEMTIDGIKLPVVRNYVGGVEEGRIVRSKLKKFNVVAGNFKQIFNAKHLMNRLLEGGYENAGVLMTPQQNYLVVAAQEDSPEAAGEELRKLSSDSSLMLRAPLPYILIPSSFRL